MKHFKALERWWMRHTWLLVVRQRRPFLTLVRQDKLMRWVRLKQVWWAGLAGY